MRRKVILLGALLLLLAACAQDDPADTVEAYLQARVDTDADTMASLSCAEWESQARVQAESFDAMNAELDGVRCSVAGEDGDFQLVSCEGQIVTTYNGESREWPLRTYRLAQEGGEWRMCGEAE